MILSHNVSKSAKYCALKACLGFHVNGWSINKNEDASLANMKTGCANSLLLMNCFTMHITSPGRPT